jgi:hypothetical protein
MQNLNPTRIIARRGRDALIIGALLLLSGLVAGGIGVLFLLLFSSGFFGAVFIVLAIVFFVGGIVFMVRGLTMRMENEPALAVADVLARELDGQYAFVRNISRRGLGYIDAVLIGPSGVLVFRIVDLPGIFLNEGADWLERKGGKPFMLSKLNATRDCVNDVYALRKFLASRQLSQVPVYAIVVFTAPGVQLSARQPVVPIAEPRTLMTVIRSDFMKENRIDAKTAEAAVNAIYQ